MFHSHISAATIAAIAAIISPIGPELSQLITDPIAFAAFITFAMVSNTGPIAATTEAIVNIMLRVPSSSPFSQSISPVTHCITPRIAGVIQSENVIASVSSAP